MFISFGCGNSKKNNTQNKMTEQEKFKKEYESLNKYVDEDGTKKYPQVIITEDNKMVYANNQKVKEILKSKTGVIYFGFPECPWCRNMVPVLIDAAKEANVEQIYYRNNQKERDQKHLDTEGNVIVDDEGSEDYKELVTLLYSELSPYRGLSNDTIKRLYYPMVVFVKDGMILGSHIGTLESQTNPKEPLTKKQQSELKNIYLHYMKMLKEDCNQAC